MSALSICQEAAAWLALPVPPTLFSSPEPQTIQLRNLLNEEGYELANWPDKAWTKLTRQQTFVTQATPEQIGALAPDYSRFIDNSIWDRTQSRPVYGPLTPEQWQQAEVWPNTTAFYGFRLRGNDWLMTPTPTAGDTIAYEYVSDRYVYAVGDSVPTKAAFSDDTDTSIFPETLMARGVRWRFLRAKGFPYAQEFAGWAETVQRVAARDGGMPTLSISRNYPWTKFSPFIPDGNFPG